MNHGATQRAACIRDLRAICSTLCVESGVIISCRAAVRLGGP
jgi:hypothetical protein